MRRSFQFPLTAAPCSEPECNVTQCRERERESEADFRRKEERERLEWTLAKDRREAALRVLYELAAEQNRPVPRGHARENYIDRILASTGQAESVRRQLAAISAE